MLRVEFNKLVLDQMVLESLQYVHSKGYAHNDIKVLEHNVMTILD